MKHKVPEVALRRRQAALAAFRAKLEVLERLLAEGDLSRFPARASFAAFASWVDIELQVVRLSRPTLYSKDAEYPELRGRLNHLLERIVQRRAKGARRESLEEYFANVLTKPTSGPRAM